MAKRSQTGKVVPIHPGADQLPRISSIEVELTSTWEEIARDVLFEAQEKRRKHSRRFLIKPKKGPP